MPMDRRNFFARATEALGALLAGGLGLPAAFYLLSPGRRNASAWVDAAGLSQLDPRVPEEVTLRRTRLDGWKIVSEKSTAWIVKLSDTDIVAFSPQCTHLGCAYHFDEKKHEFVCPCHTSNFSLEGKVLTGPAPRPLDRFEVKVENGRVLIGALVAGANPPSKG
jgi:menaquinol-cytochrome c reductase iron-sulfur subunit